MSFAVFVAAFFIAWCGSTNSLAAGNVSKCTGLLGKNAAMFSLSVSLQKKYTLS
jgi:hypothetical protein